MVNAPLLAMNAHDSRQGEPPEVLPMAPWWTPHSLPSSAARHGSQQFSASAAPKARRFGWELAQVAKRRGGAPELRRVIHGMAWHGRDRSMGRRGHVGSCGHQL